MNLYKLLSNSNPVLNLDLLLQWVTSHQDADREVAGEALVEKPVVEGKLTLIITVGIAGSGKSTLARKKPVEVVSYLLRVLSPKSVRLEFRK